MDTQSSLLTTSDLSLRFGAVDALKSVSMSAATGEIVCLLGHSGCGKSTFLRTIAGVQKPDSGTITIGGRVVCGDGAFVEPEHRNVGFMLQDYALFPHLSARQNIAFGLSKLGRDNAKRRVDAIVERLAITHLVDRYPHMLSGGEQQRIALARSLAPRPDVLLMDEPFSNLDRGLRDVLRAEVVALLRALDTTALIVTHDPEEALSIADKIVLMHQGEIVEQGDGKTLFNNPRTAYAAEFFSAINRIPARREGNHIVTPLGTFPARGTNPISEIYLRPRAITLGSGTVSGTILAHTALGEIEEWSIAIDNIEKPLIARTSARYNYAPGDNVSIKISPEDIISI